MGQRSSKRVTLKRVVMNGWRSFRRNGWLSTATILVMMLTLFVIGGLLLVSVVANTVLDDLERKIDIAIAFAKNTPQAAILEIKREIEALDAVREVSYVSAAEALEAFRERHRGDETVLASLEELGEENPLPATLNIKAGNSGDLGAIANYLTGRSYPSVEKINYFENQKVIERLAAIVRGVRSAGATIALVLGFVAVIVAFTTVRLAIYAAREEIGIMKLVGATNWYIRGPFMIEGVLHGGIAAIATAFFFFPVVWFASARLADFIPAVNLFTYFVENFLEFALILMVIGMVLGVGSSAIAIRRYLKI